MRHSLCAPEKKMDDVGGDCRRKKLLIGSFFQSRPRAKKRRHYLWHTDFFLVLKPSFQQNLIAYFKETGLLNIVRLIAIFFPLSLSHDHIFCEGHTNMTKSPKFLMFICNIYISDAKTGEALTPGSLKFVHFPACLCKDHIFQIKDP
jgi:hypothetical protein